MIEITDYRTIKPLFGLWKHDMVLCSIEEGLTKPRMWTDDASKPMCALILVKNKLRIMGFPKNMEVINDLKMFFSNLKHERHDLVVYWHEKEWEMLLKAIFQNDRVWVASRCYYENDIANLMMASNNPEGYEIREVHEVASGEYENQNDLFEEMCSETPDVPTFLRNGFGFCAATAHDLIGWCLSEYNNASGCEVGIWVSEKWRGQGVAKTLLFRFICEARRRGLTRIGWSSFSDNAPSVSTAESIGLMKIKDYHAMYVEW